MINKEVLINIMSNHLIVHPDDVYLIIKEIHKGCSLLSIVVEFANFRDCTIKYFGIDFNVETLKVLSITELEI